LKSRCIAGLPTGEPGLYADGGGGADNFRDSRWRHDYGQYGRQGLPGSKMKTIVNAPEKRFPGKTALDEAAG
jgi:UDP-N-acetylmuramoyl-tripeptide--D-alanyl-D-alanine ligase